MVKKILIIKLGAEGDVIRTLPILVGIKESYPDSKITWITKENIIDLIENIPSIDKIFTLKNYPKDSFDILYNFDIEEEATKIASEIQAKQKYGFYKEGNFPAAFNFGSEYYLNTLFDDDLKKSNKQTYQEMMFNVADMTYKKQHKGIFLTEEDKKFAEEFITKNNLRNKKLIGLHMGAGSRWPSKSWSKQKLKEFIRRSVKEGYNVLLFGGPNEKEEHSKLLNELKDNRIRILQNNPNNSNGEFAALINICELVICSDSFAMHVSLALRKPTIALFFCTSPHEVEDYGYLKKIVSKKLYDIFPSRMDQYDEEIVNSISVQEVLDVLNENHQIRVVNAIIKHPYEKKVLIIKRRNEKVHSNKWAFPGGKVKKGEQIIDALKREIMEETGIKIKNIIRKVSDYSYSGEDNKKTIGECYFVTTENTDVSINSEISDFKWVTFEGLKELDHIVGLDKELLDALY